LWQSTPNALCPVPIPPVAGVEAYHDYAQWVIEDIKTHLP
jgi:hypothetical protein